MILVYYTVIYSKTKKITIMDKIDQQLLELLAINGRSTLNDLAKAVNLSISPCQARIKKLEEQKIYFRLPCTN